MYIYPYVYLFPVKFVEIELIEDKYKYNIIQITMSLK